MGEFFIVVNFDIYVKRKHSTIKFERGFYERVVYEKSWVDQGKPKPYTLVIMHYRPVDSAQTWSLGQRR